MAVKYQPQMKASLFGRMPVGDPTRGKGKGGGIAPYKGPKGLRTEHRVGIQTPAETIWQILVDLPAWKDWNPLYTEASGEIRIGGQLDLTAVLPGTAPQKVRATVLEWVPDEQLHFQATALGGLLKVIRYVEIEQLAEASCIVSNGEILSGLFGPSVGRSHQPRVFRGLKAMNEALKARAEGLYRGA